MLTQDSTYMIDWQQNWDDAVGLWQQASGHTRPVAHLKCVHAGPTASSHLVLAAQTGQLAKLDVTRILRRLRDMQVTDGGERHGCLRWYWEEEWPVDTNAAFFTGLSLIVLWQHYRGDLPPDAREVLSALLRDLYAWFRREAQKQSWYYPNKYLGDLVCVWLLAEIAAEDESALPAEAQELAAIMLEAAAYWRNHGWGWGEHLSEGYSKVCLDELSLLSLTAKHLPEEVRAAYYGLFADLLFIGDAFGGGPRVPALRSYAFLGCPVAGNYRDTVKPLPPDVDLSGVNNCPLLGHTFHQLGWHALAPTRRSAERDLAIACFGKATARARVEADIRLGSVSHFPLMPSIENFTHGLAWQSMPVALLRPEKSWGFLQWEVAEGDRRRSHPAEDKKTTYLGNALSEAVCPPIVGRTWAIQRGGCLIALRIMPAVAQNWKRLEDRLRLIGDAGKMARAEGTWNQMLLRWGSREVSIHCLPLTGEGTVQLTTGDKATDWGVSWNREQLAGKRLIAIVWAINLGGRIETPPCLQEVAADPAVPRATEERVRHLHWSWPGCTWRLVVDPLASHPLQEVDDV